MRTLLTALPRRVWLPALVALAVAAVALGVLLTGRDGAVPRPAAVAATVATSGPASSSATFPSVEPPPSTAPPSSAVPPAPMPPPSSSAAPTPAAVTTSPRTSTPAPAPRSTGRAPAPSTSTPAPPPPPVPAPPPPPPPAPAAPDAERRVLELVNADRAAAGCPAVSADGGLAAVARAHSADMRDRGYFSHTDPEGRSPFDRAEQAGVGNARAENIARGQADADAVVRSWLDSPGHRENVLNCSYRSMGLGLATGAGGPWWTQLFGV